MVYELHVDRMFNVPLNFYGKKCLPVFSNHGIVTVFSDNNIIGIWKCPNYDKCIKLLEHQDSITALGLTPADQRYLCSCSFEKVILWDLEEVVTNSEGALSNGILLAVDMGHIEYCAFSWQRKWLALCKEKDLSIIKLEFDKTSVQCVEEHGSLDMTVSTMCAFSPDEEDILVSIEDSSHFKVWDVRKLMLLYKSANSVLLTFTYVAFTQNSKVLLGSNKGTVQVYTVTSAAAPHNTFTVDVSKAFLKESPRRYSNGACESPVTNQDCAGIGCYVYSVHMLNRKSPDVCHNLCPSCNDHQVPGFSNESEVLEAILVPGPLLLACCNLGISLYDYRSWDCLTFILFTDIVNPELSMLLLDAVALNATSLNNVQCLIKTAKPGGKLYSLVLSVLENSWLSEETDSPQTVVPSVPVNEKSALMQKPFTSDTPTPKLETIIPRLAYGKIRSSGYGEAATRNTRQMFVPVTNKTRKKSPSRLSKLTAQKSKSCDALVDGANGLMRSCSPPTVQGEKICIWKTNGTAVHMSASGDGHHLACSSTLSQICILKFITKLSTGKTITLIGHDGPVNSLHFSLDSKWLISGSNDTTARIWDWRNKRCVLNIDKSTKYTKVKGKLLKDPGPFAPVTQARFYYMDQFILLSAANSLELYSYSLRNIKNYSAENLSCMKPCRRIRKIKLSTQQVTCFTAANQFHSYIVLCGCSNKTVQVYDMNEGRLALELHDVHSRAPYQLLQIEGSRYLSHPPAMYDLFLTTALCDGVKLWDLRSARCVQKYCQHVNRIYTNGINVSPCGRFIAASSDDKCVYLYDIRSNEKCLKKLSGLGDVVMDVIFNPCKPLLAAALLNGYVHTYSSEIK